MRKHMIILGMVITVMAAGMSACGKKPLKLEAVHEDTENIINDVKAANADEIKEPESEVETEPVQTSQPTETEPILAPQPEETEPVQAPQSAETEPIPAPQPEETEPVQAPQPTETEPIPAPQPEETEPVQAPQPTETEQVTLFRQDEAKIQYDMLDYVNDARRNAGLKEYGWDSSLEEGCKIRAKELSQYFSHTRPDGTGDETAFPKNILANIAQGTLYNSGAAFNCWMSSEGHKALILRNNTEDIIVDIDNLWNDKKGEFYKKGDIIKGDNGNMCCASYNGNWFMCVNFSQQ